MNLELCWKDESCFSYGKVQDLNFSRFIVGYPFDGNLSNVGNGVMTAFHFHDSEVVERLYKIAMSCGGSSEGEPVFGNINLELSVAGRPRLLRIPGCPRKSQLVPARVFSEECTVPRDSRYRVCVSEHSLSGLFGLSGRGFTHLLEFLGSVAISTRMCDAVNVDNL